MQLADGNTGQLFLLPADFQLLFHVSQICSGITGVVPCRVGGNLHDTGYRQMQLNQLTGIESLCNCYFTFSLDDQSLLRNSNDN